MNYARITAAILTSGVAAASGTSPKSCPKFTASLRLFRKFASSNPAAALLQTVSSETITGFNTTATAYSADDEVIVGQLVDETWIIIDGSVGVGERTQIVGFEVPGGSGTLTPECWYLTITSSNPEAVVDDPPVPDGTTILYKGHSYDDYSQGDAYHTYLWIFQTCNADIASIDVWLENGGDSTIRSWVTNLAAGNDAWNTSYLQEVTGATSDIKCGRDAHVTLINNELIQPTDYTVEDIVELTDADLCDPSALCSNLDLSLNIKGRSLLVNVITRPCGMTSVSLEDENNQITVYDTLGSFMYGRTASDAAGRSGHAVLVQDEGSETCYWMITWLDWFDQIQVVSDVRIGQSGITIERKRVDIWRHCDLPDEYILGETCEETS